MSYGVRQRDPVHGTIWNVSFMTLQNGQENVKGGGVETVETMTEGQSPTVQ